MSDWARPFGPGADFIEKADHGRAPSVCRGLPEGWAAFERCCCWHGMQVGFLEAFGEAVNGIVQIIEGTMKPVGHDAWKFRQGSSDFGMLLLLQCRQSLNGRC